jgi:hypothetical protein
MLTLSIEYLAEAEVGLRRLNAQSISRDQTDSALAADLNPTLNKAGEKVLQKLGTVKHLLEVVSKEVSLPTNLG